MKTANAMRPTTTAQSLETLRPDSRSSARAIGAKDLRRICSRSLFGSIIALILFAFSVSAQDTPPECPAGMICLTRAAAEKAVETAKELDAVKIRLAAETQAVEDMRKELNNVRIEYARVAGENSALKQNAVQDRAIIEVLLKSVRPKKIGLINLF